MIEISQYDVKVESIQLSELKDAFEKDSKYGYYINLPKYQRGIVWDDARREKLIESIFSGYPVGAVLAFATRKDFGDRSVIELVDGLQRSTTILHFMKQPLKFASIDMLVKKAEIEKLTEMVLGSRSLPGGLRLVELALNDWAKTTKDLVQKNGFKSTAMLTKLKSYLNDAYLPSNEEQVTELLDEMLGEISSKINEIGKVALPLIIYQGAPKNVPEVFERINSQGIQLSKYDTFAAAWVDSRTRIHNGNISSKIDKRYADLVEQGYEISDYDPDIAISKNDFNLFEYLYGLGVFLSERYSYLFSPISGLDIPSASFVLTSVAHGLRVEQMRDLAAELKKDASGMIDLDKFEQALDDACFLVNKALSPYLTVNLNKGASTKPLIAHSQNQIISMILRVLLGKYEATTWEVKEIDDSALVLKHLPAYYVYDLLTRKWSGHGDSTLWERVWGIKEESHLNSFAVSNYYKAPIEEDLFKSAFRQWHEDQLVRLTNGRTGITKEQKTILKFVYSDLVTVLDNKKLRFEIEHLYTIGVLQKLISDFDIEGLAIGALGNLALLEHKFNRIKGKTMLGDVQIDFTDEERTNISKYVIYPELHLLKADGLNPQSYNQFLQKRSEIMLGALWRNISKGLTS